mgnify:CR=1 FL=1
MRIVAFIALTPLAIDGLTQLTGYLSAWAAFGDWCTQHQVA